MSSNTNTLFWVITGAVIVLAVFTLINNSQSDTLAKISDKFSSLATEQGIGSSESEEEETYPYELEPLDSSYIPINACGPKSATIEGYKVQVYDAYHTTDGYVRIRNRYFITNTNDSILDKTLKIQFIECGTDEIVSTTYKLLGDIKAGQTIQNGSISNSEKTITDYYIRVELD